MERILILQAEEFGELLYNKYPAVGFHSNHHAPTGERATMNESSPGAFGIPEFMPHGRLETGTEQNVL